MFKINKNKVMVKVEDEVEVEVVDTDMNEVGDLVKITIKQEKSQQEVVGEEAQGQYMKSHA